jgi:hypothetical protein
MTPTESELLRALAAICSTPHIREYLQREDPKALKQAEAAVQEALEVERALDVEIERLAAEDTREWDNAVSGGTR